MTTLVKIIYYLKRDNINLVKNILLGEEARQKGEAIVAKNNNNQSAYAYKLVGGARVVLIVRTVKRVRANVALYTIGVTKMVTRHHTVPYR